MAVVPSTKNYLELLRAMRGELNSSTSINTFERDSKARALMDIFTQEQIDTRSQAQEAFYANQLTNARGADLDRIGDTYGVPRQDITFAYAPDSTQNVAFYVEASTFGAINGGADITVPVGTLVYSAPNNNELGETVQYRVVEEKILPAAGSLGYVSVRAVSSGPNHNVGGGTIRNHNFTSYSDAVNNSLKVINFYPILNGRARERDRQYRFRLSQHMVRLKQVNDAAIQLTALGVPGVIDTRIISGYYGIGTVGVVVLGADNESSRDLVTAVQSRLNRLHGPGLRAVATASIEVLFDMELEIKSTRSIAVQDRTMMEEQIKRILLNQFRAAGIGGTVDIRQLALAIQAETSGLIRLGAAGSRTDLFKNIYIRQGFSNGVMSERERLITDNYTLEQDAYADLGTISFAWVS